MAEHLRKCESFAELRIAMRVVLRGCLRCGKEHALSLVDKAEVRAVRGPLTEAKADWELSWRTAPRTGCAPRSDWASTLVITPSAVADGRVFIVEERDEQQATTTRKLEHVE